MAAGGGRKYTGYMQANQSVLEEEEENDDEDGNKDDLEAGRVNRGESNIFHNPPGASLARSTLGGRRVSWGRENAELSVLRPNIHSQDAAADSSDDEVPQSFMIEASAPRRKSSLRSGKGKARAMDGSARVGIADSRGTPPLLPVGAQVPPGARVSIPPRPSEVDPEQDPEISTAPTTSPLPPKPMRGLDAYERALWNWVNVYNLDAFLQEVYFYYEGKGIYCIALSRALNLLLVPHLLDLLPLFQLNTFP
jgi:autophagy-related protein 9